MSNLWVTADLHFGHVGIVKKGRPFSSVEEMDEALIERWNARVRPNDRVHVIGDFSGSTDAAYLGRIFKLLNGFKELEWGNHDSRAVMQLPWVGRSEQRVIKHDGLKFVLAHHFRASWDHMYRGSYHLFGHTHGHLVPRGRSMDVGVDSWGYEPISIEEAVFAMKKYNKDFHSYVPEHKAIQRFRIHENDVGKLADDGLDGRDYLEENLRIEVEEGLTGAEAPLGLQLREAVS